MPIRQLVLVRKDRYRDYAKPEYNSNQPGKPILRWLWRRLLKVEYTSCGHLRRQHSGCGLAYPW